MSPVPSRFSADECLEEVIEHPSTPDSFEAVKDLIELSAPNPLLCREKPSGITQEGAVQREAGNGAPLKVTLSALLLAPLPFKRGILLFPGTRDPV